MKSWLPSRKSEHEKPSSVISFRSNSDTSSAASRLSLGRYSTSSTSASLTASISPKLNSMPLGIFRRPGSVSVAPVTPENPSFSLQDLLDDGFLPGPKVKPFAYLQGSSRDGLPRKLNSGSICSICQTQTATKLFNEKNIFLNCGECIHEKCLEALVEVLPAGKFPKCGGTLCRKLNEEHNIEPVDNRIIPNMRRRSSFQINQQQQQQQQQQHQQLQLLLLRQLRYSLRAQSPPPRLFIPKPHRPAPRALSSSSRVRSMQSLRSTLRPNSVTPCVPTHSFTPSIDHSLASSMYSISRVASPTPTESSIQTLTVRIDANKDVPIENLTNTFLKHLFENNKDFPFSYLLQCGNLRLVDILMGSTTPGKVGQATCYLFQYFLVVWSKEEGKTYILPLSSVRFKMIQKATTILKIVDTTDSNTEIYLFSENSSIIEKWVIALSDFKFNFPSDLITSTLNFTEDIKKSEEPIIIEDSPTETINPNMNAIESKIDRSKPYSHSNSDPESESDSDSDSDSDSGLIEKYSKMKKIPKKRNIELPSPTIRLESDVENSLESEEENIQKHSSHQALQNIPILKHGNSVNSKRLSFYSHVDLNSDSDSDSDSYIDSDNEEIERHIKLTRATKTTLPLARVVEVTASSETSNNDLSPILDGWTDLLVHIDTAIVDSF